MRQFGLIASMEEIDNTPITDEVEAAEVATTVADDSAAVQAESDEIGTSVTEIEDAVQAGDELQDIGEVAADAVESGDGLDEPAAELASIAIESIRNRLGIRATTRLVPACESFGNANTRLVSTRMIVEGVSDTIKRVWVAIKAAVARVWDKIKSFFNSLFQSTAGLTKHISSLRERARALPGSAKPMEKKLKNSALAKAFTSKGKADSSTVDVIVKNTLVMADVAAAIGAGQVEVSNAASALASGEINKDTVKAFLAKQKKAADGINAITKNKFVVADSALAPDAAMKSAKAKKTDKSLTFLYGPFVGNTALSVVTTESEFLGEKCLRVSMSFVGAKGKNAEEIEALDVNGVQKVLADAAKLANGLADFKKVQGEYDAITKAVNKVADTVMNSATKILDKTGSNAETSQGLSELKNEVSATVASMGSFGNRAPTLVYSLAKSLADYASASLRNLREDGKGAY